MKKALPLFTFLFICSICQGQVKMFTAIEAQKDVSMLKMAMEEGNPALLRYQTKKQWENLVNQLEEKIKTGINAIDFYLSLSKLVAKIGDGHTRMILPKDYSDFINFESNSIIPLALRFIDDNIYVQYNYSNDKRIMVGAELLALNEISSKFLLNKLLSFVSADNFNKGFLNRRIELEYRQLIPLLFNLGKTYRLKFKNPNGEVFTAIINGTATTIIDSIAKINNKAKIVSNTPWRFSVDTGKNTSVLQVSDFLRSPDKNYLKFLDSAFSVLSEKKIKHLVIDLRENTGGYDEHAIALLSYLVNRDFTYYSKRIINKTYYDFLKYTNSEFYNQMVKNFTTSLQADSTYLLTVPWDAQYGKKESKAFNGNLYFLINNRVFSSAMVLAAIAYNYSDALFIGEETGGAYTGDSGAPVLLTLPSSKFLVQIPLVRYEYAVTRKNKGKGLSPQFFVSNRMEDILKERDRQMEFVLRLIAQK